MNWKWPKEIVKISAKFNFCLAISIVGWWNTTIGQEQSGTHSSQPLKFSHISSKDGLPQNSVLAIHQDENGFIWMGTDDGLARYDGYEFRVFRHTNEKNSLSNNVIRAIISDPLGNIWIGTEGGGVNIFDVRNEEFIQVDSTSSSLAKAKISGLILTKDQHIIAATNGNGIFDFHLDFSKSQRVKDYMMSLDIQHFHTGNSKLTDNKIWSVFEDTKNKLWIGTLESGACVKEGNDFTSVYLIDQKDTVTSVKSFFEDNDKNLWFGTEKNGLFLLSDTKSTTIEKIPLPCKKKHPHPSGLNITSFQQDDSGNLWIGTLGEGLFILDKERKESNHYQDEPNNPYSLNGNSVYTQYKDRSGIIWLGMYSGEGLNKVSPNQQQFEHIRYDPNLQQGLSGKMVKSILKDSQGNLWVGLFNGGISLLKIGAKQFQYFTARNSSILPHNNVQAIFERSNGDIWIGTDGGGIAVVDSKQRLLRVFKQNPADPNSLKKNEIWSIVEDPGGHLWIGTANGGGLHRFDPKNGEFENFKHNTENSNSPLFNDVRALLVDSKNNLWIGTYGGGLSKMSLSNGQFSHFSPNDSYTGSLSHGIITSIMEDQKGYIWVGTFGGGLNRINPLDGKIKIIREKDGLPSDIVKAILEDNDGQIWISTVNGLSSLNPDTFTFKNYREEDGLQSDEFNLGSAFKHESGKLFFGGINGFNSFFPDKIQPYPSPTPPVLTGFRVLNKEVLPHQKVINSVILNQSISHTDYISLNHTHNSFEFEFSSLEYLSQDKINYYYRLDGYDQDWIQVDSKRRFATYANLKPGTYQFQIKSAYEGDLLFSPTRTVTLEILPPWYMSTWAVLLYLILFLLTAYGIKLFIAWRYKLRNDLKLERIEKQKQEEINQIKLRFFTNISHELRTPLMLIKSPLEQLIKRPDLPTPVTTQLESINSNAARLVKLINQLLEFRKQETGNLKLSVKRVHLRDYFFEIKQSFQVIADQRNIQFELEFVEPLPEFLWFDPDQMEKVFFNLIYNAFKFTLADEGRIKIKVRGELKKINQVAQQGVTIEIIDNGKGIPESQIKHIFDRFFQIRQSGRTSDMGTGIGLALSKNLVDFHHGTITAESIPKQETIFSVWMRFGFDHFEKHELIPLQESEMEQEWIRGQMTNIYQDSISTNLPIFSNQGGKKDNKILLVEDNPELLNLLTHAFQSHFEVKVATNGKIGLEILQNESVDFIVSDIMMPEMDGIEFCARVKSQLESSHIPLILLTAKSSHEHQLEGYESGADDYISKPFELDLLVHKVQNILQTRQKQHAQFSSSTEYTPTKLNLTSPDEKFINDSIKIIEENIEKEDFSVQELVKEIGISRTLVFEKFKSLIGQTPNEFILMIRMKRAAQLLRDSDLKINEISYKTGFSNPKYFSKLFQKQFGSTPSTFRKGVDNKEKNLQR